MKYYFLFLALIASNFMVAQSEHSALLKGTIAYQNGDFETAQQNFQQALTKNNNSLKGNFNLGNALFKRQKYDEAATYYQHALSNAQNATEKAQALYNFGNTRLAQAKNNMQPQGQGAATLNEQGQKQLKEAIEAYKNALRNNAQDYDAKNNLATAYKLLRQQQQQQQQQNKNQEQQQDQNKNQEQQDQQNKEEQSKDEQQKNSSDSEQQNQPINNDPAQEGKPIEAEELSKNEVDRLLEIIEQDDKKVQEKLMERKRAKTKKPEKAW